MVLQGKGILSELQKKVLNLLGQLPDISRFYLTGGTALAEFYLGHRLSFDLDLFTTEEGLIVPFSRQIERTLTHHGLGVQVTRRFSTFVEMTIVGDGDSLRLDLALDTPVRFATSLPSPYGVPINVFEDLKAEKTLAYYGRAEPRDAVDLYFLLKENELQALMRLAAEKDAGFDAYWFAVALQRAQNFPDDLEKWPVKMLIPFDPKDLKTQFQQLALAILHEITGG
ncbi:Domain of unknown function DUF1814 [Thermodesulfatator indicus DSM 15286]|uniref:Nucleotidyl transferase AbiEii/AbiGii toxin family protein n=1 Tax=Thermodesulfatator indicus (strain DSM 15286 / JCM 11887 / CIR29812) TaxID=667014 RepID=F8AE45_THEID|nr:nucleotidyl transferase AbiEii/AbiGii toxin family protein [Thermodesulfatator indicus]AEH44105.1 Domain of unknown function DUF1814 [Thermodesulfatator indicus DSM 15286]